MSYKKDYSDCLEYIDQFWDKVTIRPLKREKILSVIINKAQQRMHKNIINMPYSFIVPNTSKFTHVYYWDTFFMFRGLIDTKRSSLLKSMVNNFSYIYNKYGIIPNFNSPASIGRSQPPLLTSMILDTYYGYYYKYKKLNPVQKALFDFDQYTIWLGKMAEVAKREYRHVWTDHGGYFHHRVKGYKLSKYGDRDIGYAHSAELESGWDFTSRFANRCDEYLPIDLNVFLYKYERDFVKIAEIIGPTDDKAYWKELQNKRKIEINKLMWSKTKGFFFDYDYRKKKRSAFYSLAGFTPLWAGLATPDQAKKMVKHLKKFETDHGLAITALESLAKEADLSSVQPRYRSAIEDVLKPKQWDYPNIWPPLEYLTVVGLLKYGYISDAVRIMKKSLTTQAKVYRKYKTFFEKIDGLKGDKTGNYHYENQSGFGWTNAIFYRYVQILDSIEESNGNIYVEKEMKEAPFKLSIPH